MRVTNHRYTARTIVLYRARTVYGVRYHDIVYTDDAKFKNLKQKQA